MKRRNILLASAGLGLCALAAVPVHAQGTAAAGATTLEEVVVTAERRTADVQKTAAAVSVRSGDELAREGRFSLNQILEDVPGVSGLTTSGIGGLGTDSPEVGIAIRGVRANNAGAGVVGPPVSATTAVYVDGVYGGVGGGYDIDRVEVLRGPQGTLYGRSATGGVIATYTRNPDAGGFDANLIAELGNYELRHFSGAVNAPLIEDKLALRVSANHYERAGYDHAKGGAVMSRDARIKALWTPSEDISVLLGAAMQDNTLHSGGVVLRASGPDSYKVDPTAPLAQGKSQFRQYWAQIDWNLGGMTLTYLPAYRDYEQAGVTYVVAPTAGYYKQTLGEPDDSYVTHELHLASAEGSRFAWQVGAIYYKNDVGRFFSYIDWLSSGALVNRRDYSRSVTNYGVFAEGTYPILQDTRLTLGLRHDKDEIRTNASLLQNNNRAVRPGTATAGLPESNVLFTVTGAAGAADFSETTYKVRLEHDFTEHNMAYGMVSTAFIPGDVQISSSVPPAANKYSAEELTAYEIGTKNRFLDGRLQINAAAFFYDYGGYQSTVTPNPADPSVQLFVVTPARMQGFELESLFQLTEADRIGFDVGHIDAYYVDTTPAFRVAVARKQINGISPTTVNLSWEHAFELAGGAELTFRADAAYRAAYNLNAIGASLLAQGGEAYIRVEDQVTGNLSLDWTSGDGRFGVSGYVRNVGDERYKVAASLQSVSPLNGTYSLSDPRTYGVVLRASF